MESQTVKKEKNLLTKQQHLIKFSDERKCTKRLFIFSLRSTVTIVNQVGSFYVVENTMRSLFELQN